MESSINAAQNTGESERAALWPALPYEAWRDTCQTLHLWTQVVGTVRLELSPFLNHWWHVTLYVTPRWLTTSGIPYGGGTFVGSFDFILNNPFMSTSGGTTKGLCPTPPSLGPFFTQ